MVYRASWILPEERIGNTWCPVFQFTQQDVQRIEMEGSKPGASCTMQLLKDMENRGYDVEDLEKIIKISGNENALKCLQNGLESKSMMRKDKYSKSVHHDHECTKRSLAWEGYHERAENLTGTRETLMDSPVQQLRNKIVPYNPLPGTRETLSLNNAIQLQSPSEIGPRNPGPGTKKASINKVIHRQSSLKIAQQNKGPWTRGTLTVDNPTQQQSGTMCPHIPVQETKGKTPVLHDPRDENFATENDEILYEGASGQRREIKRTMDATTNKKKALYEEGDTGEDNLQQVSFKNCFSLAAFPCNVLAWMMSCGSQT